MYDGLAHPTLTGLPIEVGRQIVKRLPSADVGSMQRVCKRARSMSQEELIDLSMTMPSKKEFTDCVLHVIDCRSTIGMAWFYPPRGEVAVHTGVYMLQSYIAALRMPTCLLCGEFSIDIEDETGAVEVIGHFCDDKDESWELYEDIQAGTLDIFNKGIPAPQPLLATLRRRLSCRRKYQEMHGVDEYGLSIATEHMKAVLYPYLVPILGENVNVLYTTSPLVLLPAGIEIEVLKKYEYNLAVLKILVWGWLGVINGDISDIVENVRDTTTLDSSALLEEASNLLIGIRAVNLRGEMAKIERLILPTDKEIIEWFKSKMQKKEPFVFSIYEKNGGFGKGVIRIVVSGYEPLSVEQTLVRKWKYSQYKHVLIQGELPNEARLETILETGDIPGVLDPFTILQVMRSRINTSPIDAECVRDFLVELIHGTFYSFAHWDHHRTLITTDGLIKGEIRLARIGEMVHNEFVTKRDYKRSIGTMQLYAYFWLGYGTNEERSSLIKPMPIAEQPNETYSQDTPPTEEEKELLHVEATGLVLLLRSMYLSIK